MNPFNLNNKTPLFAVSNGDNSTPVYLWADPTTHALVVTGSVAISGGATEAKQDVGNASLASIDSKTPALGQATMASSSPVVIASNQSNLVIVGAGTSGTPSGGVLTVQGIGIAGVVTVGGTITTVTTLTNITNWGNIVDDAAFTPGTTRVLMAGFEFDDTAPDSVNEGDGGAARMSANRNIYTTLRDAAGNERGANITAANALLVDNSANTQPISGTVTANAGTNLNTSLLALDSTLTGGNQQVQGNAASGAADSGNPVKVGGRYNSTQPTLTNTQRGDLQQDTRGNLKATLFFNDTATAISAEADNADGVAASATTNNISTVNRNTVWNGSTWDRISGDTTGVNVKAIVNALPAGTNNIGDVDVASSALPTGASTSANQATIIGHLDGVETLLTDIEADTDTLAVVGGGVEATALRVTLANDSTGLVSVDDNGGSLTVDGTVSVTGVSTLAEQQSQTTHLATIAGDTTDIEAAVELLDDTVATLGTTTYTEATTKGLIIGVVRRDANTSLVDTTNEITSLQVNATGELKVALIQPLPTGTNTIGALTANQSVNMAQVGATNIATDTGNASGGTIRVVHANNGPTIIVDNAAFTDGSTRVAMAGYIFDEVAGTALTENDAAAARIDSKRAVVGTIEDATTRGQRAAVSSIGALKVDVAATTAGGYTPGKLVSAATTNATSVKASAGTLGFVTASNVNAAARYLKFYNKASAPTVGTDVPVLTFIIPGNTAGAGTNIPIPPQGINFSTGIAFALTTEATDAGSTGVAANEIVVNYGYI